jgi:hypothetical protein
MNNRPSAIGRTLIAHEYLEVAIRLRETTTQGASNMLDLIASEQDYAGFLHTFPNFV